MSEGKQRNPGEHGTVPAQSVLFIDQNPESFQRQNVRAIASHARKWQTARRHEQRRTLAQREAKYVRGLVGWQSASGQSSSNKTSRGSPVDALTPKSPAEEGERGDDSQSMQVQISGGLRADPFDSLPLPKSKAVMEMVDYCRYSRLVLKI